MISSDRPPILPSSSNITRMPKLSPNNPEAETLQTIFNELFSLAIDSKEKTVSMVENVDKQINAKIITAKITKLTAETSGFRGFFNWISGQYQNKKDALEYYLAINDFCTNIQSNEKINLETKTQTLIKENERLKKEVAELKAKQKESGAKASKNFETKDTQTTDIQTRDGEIQTEDNQEFKNDKEEGSTDKDTDSITSSSSQSLSSKETENDIFGDWDLKDVNYVDDEDKTPSATTQKRHLGKNENRDKLTALENQLSELTIKLKQLETENQQLKERKNFTVKLSTVEEKPVHAEITTETTQPKIEKRLPLAFASQITSRRKTGDEEQQAETIQPKEEKKTSKVNPLLSQIVQGKQLKSSQESTDKTRGKQVEQKKNNSLLDEIKRKAPKKETEEEPTAAIKEINIFENLPEPAKHFKIENEPELDKYKMEKYNLDIKTIDKEILLQFTDEQLNERLKEIDKNKDSISAYQKSTNEKINNYKKEFDNALEIVKNAINQYEKLSNNDKEINEEKLKIDKKISLIEKNLLSLKEEKDNYELSVIFEDKLEKLLIISDKQFDEINEKTLDSLFKKSNFQKHLNNELTKLQTKQNNIRLKTKKNTIEMKQTKEIQNNNNEFKYFKNIIEIKENEFKLNDHELRTQHTKPNEDLEKLIDEKNLIKKLQNKEKMNVDTKTNEILEKLSKRKESMNRYATQVHTKTEDTVQSKEEPSNIPSVNESLFSKVKNMNSFPVDDDENDFT